MSSLFRKEALDHQRARLWGDVIIVQPTSFHVIAFVFLVIFVFAGVFLASQSYARKETVQGFLAPSGGLANIYASYGGTIDAVHVSPGDRVEKGQSLASIKLDRRLPSGASSSEIAEQSLRRELEDTITRLSNTDVRLAKELAGLNSRLTAQQAELEAAMSESTILKDRIALARKQYDAAVELAEQGYATQRTVDARQEALLGLRQQQTALIRQITSLTSAIEQTEGSIELLPLRYDEEKANLRQRKEFLDRQLSEQALATGYTLSAPIDGYVTAVLKSVGAATQANTPVIVIRPVDSNLIAKLLVPSRAAGLLKAGQSAKIQYDAFPYQRFGVFGGTINSVAETVVAPGEIQVPVLMQEAFYIVDVELAQNNIDVAGQSIALKPGMLLTADVTLEERSLVEWIFDPILAIRGKL